MISPSPSKKTILIFSCFYDPLIGGAERYVKEITERLKDKYKFLILTSWFSRKLPRRENKDGIEILRLGFGFKFDKYLYPILAPLKSFSIKKDLIHAVLESYAALALFFYRLFDKKTPTLLTLQSEKVRMPKFLFKKIHQAPDKIQAISTALAKRAKAFGAKDVFVIPNGVDLDVFNNLNFVKKEKHRIICVARLDKVKGVKYLIDAMPKILEKFSDAKLVLIGDGSEKKNLKSQALNLKIDKVVEFKGALPYEKIPEELIKSEVFVLPSISEGMGIAIVEAQAAGIPVIGTNVGGIPDLIEDGKTGILVEPKNSEEIAKAVIKILSNPEFAEKLVENAKRNLKKYHWREIALKIKEIYEQLIKNSERVKILIATGIFPPDIGGPATYSEKLAQEFKKRGIDIEVVCYSDVKEYGDYDFPVFRIWRKHPRGIRHFLYFLKLLKIGKKTHLIYAQDLISAGIPALLVSKFLKKKLIVKIVGDYAWETGQRKSKVKENLEDFQNKKYNFWIEFIRSFQKIVAKKADKIIVPSQYLKKIVLLWGVREEKITVIYNAVEKTFDMPISKKEAKKKINVEGDIILSIGRLTPWKGFSALIEIMPDLLKENPKFRLVIVGEGQEEKNLKSQISKLKIENEVKLVGKIFHKEIPLYFKASDIFVLNSEYEGLSHVVLEAMQFEIPIVASNRGGNPELIQDDFNGILIEYNNKEQIKNAILKLWRDKNLQQKFIQNSKEKLKEFSWENLVEKTFKTLQSI